MIKNIKFLDLFYEHKAIEKEIQVEFSKIFETSSFIKGKVVGEFSSDLEKYLQVKHVIPCANGTDALQISLMALGLNEGDEVITSSFSFVSTVEVIALLKLKPVVVDVHPDTFNIDTKLIEQAINSKTKAIIPVHLFGQCANMEEIRKIAQKHNLYIVEDACQSIGSEYKFKNGTRKKAGSIGNLGAFSFFPSKNLGAYGDGGAISTNDSKLAEKVQSITNHGMYEKYYYKNIGLNSRLDSLQAAVLKVKLKYLDEKIKKRQQTAQEYDKTFSLCQQVVTPKLSGFSSHSYHQYTLQCEKRDELMRFLNQKGVPCGIYYPLPIHLQKAYAYLGMKKGSLPVSERLSEKVLSIPVHPALEKSQIDYICEQIINFYS